jgi:recombination protein RecA
MRIPPKRQPHAQQIDISKLAQAIKQQFGSESVSIPGNDPDFMLKKVPCWIDVGFFNPVLGHPQKGLACGYYVETSGGESAGKTTLMNYIIGLAQKQNVITVLADVEHSYDPDWSAKQGVDNTQLIRLESAYVRDKKMIVSNVDDHFKEWVYILTEAKRLYGDTPKLLVVDSLAAMLPKEQLEGDYGDRGVAALARAMAVNLPKFHSVLVDTVTSCVFINQLRRKIGVLFGEQQESPGGSAKNFYFFSRVRVQRVKTLKSGEKATGIQVKVANKKNKLGVPFRSVEFAIMFDKGVQVR